MFMHKTKDGLVIPISEMSDQHLINTINYIKKRAVDGVAIMTGSYGCDAEQMDADVDYIYGDKAIKLLGLEHYVAEYNNRKNSSKKVIKCIKCGRIVNDDSYSFPVGESPQAICRYCIRRERTACGKELLGLYNIASEVPFAEAILDGNLADIYDNDEY